MVDERRIPDEGTNPYASHPGFVADDCPLRTTVTDDNMGSIRGGFSCWHTGGHCLPHDNNVCQSRREGAKRQQQLQELIRTGQPIPDELMRG